MRTAQSEFDLRRIHIPMALIHLYEGVDTSWHNDVCPSFVLMRKWKLWVDYDLPRSREAQGRKYTVMKIDEDGESYGDPVFETDSIKELDRWLKENT